MEEKVCDVLDDLGNITNLMMVLNDSLKLSFRENKGNDYQYLFSEMILDKLDIAREKLDVIDCELCALKEGLKSTPHSNL